MSKLEVSPLASAPFTSSQTWTDTFMLVCYLMAVVCLFGGVQKALKVETRTTWAVFKELLVFGFFVFMFWSLESYAHYRTPYYVYSRSFHDLIPQAHYFEPWIENWKRLYDYCTDRVLGFEGDKGMIPLSVVLLEASLTYAALHTAKLLNGPIGAQPVFAGLVLVTVDALLDPVVAMGHACNPALRGAPVPATGNGIGLWHWYTPVVDDLAYKAETLLAHPGKESGKHALALFFHIPLFNYAAWFGAPIILVALVNLLGPVRRDWAPAASKGLLARLRSRSAPSSDEGKKGKIENAQVLLLFIIAITVSLIIWAAPAHDLSERNQYLAIVAGVAVALWILIHNFGTLDHIDRVDATLVQPVAFALALPAAAGLLTGQFIASPWLMPVAVFALSFGMWLAWLPYRDALERLSQLIGVVDRFVRVHYLGFTTMLVLLGASYFTNRPDNRSFLGLLVIAMCFHVFAYVSNDVFDLELDRKNPLRANAPLVSGLITVPTALALALSTIPVSILTTFLLVDFRLGESLQCLAVLGVAWLLMTFYNWKGKRLKVPFITDLAQGLAWGSLGLYGGLVAAANGSEPFSFGLVFSKCWLLAAYGTGFIFLINGIHGGLRDLPTDKANGRFTAAIVLGAQPGPADPADPKRQPVVSTAAIIIFAHAVNVALFGLVAYFLWLASTAKQSEPGADGVLSDALAGVAIAVVLFLLNVVVLQNVVKIQSPKRNDWVSWGVFCLLLPPIAMFLLVTPPVTAFKMAVLLSFFVPLLLQQNHLDRIIDAVYRNDGLKGCVVRGARAILPKRKDSEPLAALAGTNLHIDQED